MKKVVIYYNFIIVTSMVVMGFVGAESIPQLFSAAFFFPLAFYFSLLILPKKGKAIVFPQPREISIPPSVPIRIKSTKTKRKSEETPVIEEGVPEDAPEGFDINRRAFLKLIGSAGMTVFLFSIFTKKAQAAFFGSVPGPGTVSLKDTSGQQIDPAQKHPTDGYKIAELDDAIPSFYGFTNKDGEWFIMREEDTGAYRYAKGVSDFSTNWGNRSSLTYQYFEDVF